MAQPLAGRCCAVFGFANHRSLAWGAARAYQAAGAAVVVGLAHERFRPALERLTAAWPVPPTVVVADVTDDAALDAAFGAIAAAHGGRLHALLHAVAHAPASALRAPLLECSRADFAATLDVSAFSLLALARRAAPLLEAAGGGSVAALSFAGAARAAPGYGVMGPAKAALEALVRALAVELGPRGVAVNAISPGPVDTLAARGLPGFTALRDRVRAATPVGGAGGGRPITLDDVGALAAFLATDAGRAVSGQTLLVDAGFSAQYCAAP